MSFLFRSIRSHWIVITVVPTIERKWSIFRRTYSEYLTTLAIRDFSQKRHISNSGYNKRVLILVLSSLPLPLDQSTHFMINLMCTSFVINTSEMKWVLRTWTIQILPRDLYEHIVLGFQSVLLSASIFRNSADSIEVTYILRLTS